MPDTQDNKILITHYGLFWSESSVFWGRQKFKGELLGRTKPKPGRQGAPTTAEREENEQDFRDYVGIYCLYGGGELIYVGQAGVGKDGKGTKSTLFKRLKDHRTDHLSGRWDRFSWFGCKRSDLDLEKREKITHLDSLAQLEAILIAITNPRFNKQSGAFKEADQVFQVPHRESDGDIADKLKRMENVLKEISETVALTKK